MAGSRRWRGSLISAIAGLVLLAAPGSASAVLRFDPFEHYESDGANPASIAVADFNQDGKPDLAIGNRGAGSTPPPNLVLRLGKGDGTFGPASSFPTPGFGDLTIADFNADGDPDVAATGTGGVAIRLGGAGASLGDSTTYGVTGLNTSITTGQFDPPDTHPDLALTNGNPPNESRLAVLLGANGGAFGGASYYTSLTATGVVPLGGVAADLNADGDPDVAMTDLDSPNVIILAGAAGGTFAAPTFSDAGVGAVQPYLAAGLFNADSDPDLVLGSSLSQVAVLIGGTGVTFAAPSELAVRNQSTVSGVATGDVDSDGKVDIAAVDSNDTNERIGILLGDGTGAFGPAKLYGSMPPAGSAELAMADFNADGHPDLALTERTQNKVAVLLSDYSKPQTKLKQRPPATVRSRSVTYRLDSNESGSTFECKLDASGFKDCKRRARLRRLHAGKHTFQARATDPAGNTDASPAKDSFTVK